MRVENRESLNTAIKFDNLRTVASVMHPRSEDVWTPGSDRNPKVQLEPQGVRTMNRRGNSGDASLSPSGAIGNVSGWAELLGADLSPATRPNICDLTAGLCLTTEVLTRFSIKFGG